MTGCHDPPALPLAHTVVQANSTEGPGQRGFELVGINQSTIAGRRGGFRKTSVLKNGDRARKSIPCGRSHEVLALARDAPSQELLFPEKRSEEHTSELQSRGHL